MTSSTGSSVFSSMTGYDDNSRSGVPTFEDEQPIQKRTWRHTKIGPAFVRRDLYSLFSFSYSHRTHEGYRFRRVIETLAVDNKHNSHSRRLLAALRQHKLVYTGNLVLIHLHDDSPQKCIRPQERTPPRGGTARGELPPLSASPTCQSPAGRYTHLFVTRPLYTNQRTDPGGWSRWRGHLATCRAFASSRFPSGVYRSASL